MRVTTKGRYALRALTKLALYDGDRPVPIKRIAEEEDLSPEFLEQIFFRLKKAGVIKSVRGPGGGFMLNQDPAEITAKDIFEAVGEGIDLTPCTSATEDCDRRPDCVVNEVWEDASAYIIDYFSKLTLASILERHKDRTQSAVSV
jgi:Rrf2 family iron-sulfur cluster assembly transcriptional regulator